MKTLTDEKLTIVGAAGMIGSNMAQTAIMMGLTSNICLYRDMEGMIRVPDISGAEKHTRRNS